MKRLLSLAVVYGLCGVALAQDARQPPAKADAVKLVEQLGSGSFSEREEAEKKLDALGTPALSALKAALSSSDEEVKERAKTLIKKIEGRVQTENALKAPRITFNVRNVTLAEAVRDLSNRSGVRIMIARDPGTLSTRKVNIELGETTFWKAFDELCVQAKVGPRPSQWDPAIVQEDPNNPNAAMLARQRAMMMGNNNSQVFEEQIVLQEGETNKIPSATLGPIRLRVLPEPRAKETDAQKWRFEILGEPQINWLVAPKVIFEKAGEEKKYAEISINAPADDPNNPNARFMRQQQQFQQQQFMMDAEFNRTGVRSITRNLSRHELPTTISWPEGLNVSDIKGRLKGTIESPMTVIMSSDTPDLEKEGPLASDKTRTVSIRNGSAKRFDGTYDINFEIMTNLLDGDENQRNVGFSSRVSTFGQSSREIRIYDQKGREYELQNSGSSGTNSNGKTMTRTFRVTLRPPEGDSVPTKFEFWAPGKAEIDAPFVIQGVKKPE